MTSDGKVFQASMMSIFDESAAELLKVGETSND